MSLISPVYKADDKTKFTNYRPISVLPCFSKILEKRAHFLTIYLVSLNTSTVTTTDYLKVQDPLPSARVEKGAFFEHATRARTCLVREFASLALLDVRILHRLIVM